METMTTMTKATERAIFMKLRAKRQRLAKDEVFKPEVFHIHWFKEPLHQIRWLVRRPDPWLA
jgi:hypothetical protein